MKCENKIPKCKRNVHLMVVMYCYTVIIIFVVVRGIESFVQSITFLCMSLFHCLNKY